jgi:hypothetical protein
MALTGGRIVAAAIPSALSRPSDKTDKPCPQSNGDGFGPNVAECGTCRGSGTA